MIQKVGIIGAGAFGQLLAETLGPHVEVLIYDTKPVAQGTLPDNASIRSFEEVVRCSVIIIAVNLQHMKTVCQALKQRVHKDTIVMDVCSVKVRPAQIMQEALGDNCKLLATHPLFGPQSFAKNNGTNGLEIVWHELSGGPFTELEDLFSSKLGLDIIRMTPDEHDQEMAWVHGLTFFVGRGLVNSNIPEMKLQTGYFTHLTRLRDLELQHSEELFNTIEQGNPYAKEVRSKFMKTLEQLENTIGKGK